VAAAGNASTAAAVSSGGDAGGGGCSEVLSLREGSLDALGAMLILGGQGL
jgi:hypothetical protein